ASNFEAMYFNLDKPALKDVTVRKAISMAINYNALIQTARRGRQCRSVPITVRHMCLDSSQMLLAPSMTLPLQIPCWIKQDIRKARTAYVQRTARGWSSCIRRRRTM